MKKKLNILCFDPGSKNFGYGLIKVVDDGQTLNYTLVEHGKLVHAFNEMKGPDVAQRAKLFQKEVRALAKRLGATHLIAERYMVRGRFGATAEHVNFMLGLLVGLNIPNMLLIPAAQWKNQWNKNKVGLTLDEFYRQVDCEPHQVDAVSIGLYGAAWWLNIPFFEMLDSTEGIQQFWRLLVKANLGKIVNIRDKSLCQACAKKKSKK